MLTRNDLRKGCVRNLRQRRQNKVLFEALEQRVLLSNGYTLDTVTEGRLDAAVDWAATREDKLDVYPNQIGAGAADGADKSYGSDPTGSGRLNISTTYSYSYPPNTTYKVRDFKYTSPQNGGSVIPFLSQKVLTTIDDGDATGFSTTGTWSTGSSYKYLTAGTGQNHAFWTFGGLTGGQQYEVSVTWPDDPNHVNASDAPFSVYSGSSTTPLGSFLVDQRIHPNNPSDGWYSLGSFTVGTNDTSLKVELTDNTCTGITNINTGQVVADAVQLSSYKTLWVGPQESVTAGTHTKSYTLADNQTFATAGLTTTIYPGFYAINGAQVSFAESGSTVQDRAGGTVYRPTAKDQVIAGFSDPSLGRSYAFGIDTEGSASVAVGPGHDNSKTYVDSTTPSELDVFKTGSSLDAGTYNVDSFNFASTSSSGGYVTPFLVKLVGTTYTTIWVGLSVQDNSSTTTTATYSPGDEYFTLTDVTDVYAGFYTDSAARVSYYTGSGSAADYDDDSTPTRPTPHQVGQTMLQSAFSNDQQRYKRKYDYAINFSAPLRLGFGAMDQNDGSSLNVDQSHSKNLNKDTTYTVESIQFDALAAVGTVTPFLAVSTGGDSYAPIWVGGSVSPQAGTNYFAYPYGAAPSTIIDDGGAGFTTGGTSWGTPVNHKDANDGSYLSHAVGTASDTATWTFNVTGRYEVFATWKASTGNATNAPFNVYNGAQLLTTLPVPVDQTQTPTDRWQSLGIFTITTGNSLKVQLSADANGAVVADGIRILDATNRFRFSADATVYTGFYTANGATVLYSRAQANSTVDHDSVFTTPIGSSIDSFSNPNLQRNYAFELNLASTEKDRIPDFVRTLLANDPTAADIDRANRLISEYNDWYYTAWQCDRRDSVTHATENDPATSLVDRRGAEDPPVPPMITDLAEVYLQYGDKFTSGGKAFLTDDSKQIIERQAYDFVYYRSAIDTHGYWVGHAFEGDALHASDDPRTNNAAYSVWYQVGSENHNLTDFLAPTLLGLRILSAPKSQTPPYGPNTTLANLDGNRNAFTVQQHYDAWINYWKQWVTARTNAGINSEIETSSYQGAFNALYNVYDGSGSSVLQGMVGDLLNVFWAEMAEQYYPATGMAGGFAGTRVKASDDYLGGAAWHQKLTYAYAWTDKDFLSAAYDYGEEAHIISPSRETSMVDSCFYTSAYRVPDLITDLAQAPDANKAAFMATYRRPGSGTDKIDQAGNEINEFVFNNGDSSLLKSVSRNPAYTLSGLSYDESNAYAQGSIERTAGVSFPTLPYDRLVAIGDDSGTAAYTAVWANYEHNYTRFGINTAVYNDAMVVAKDTNSYNHTDDRYVSYTPPATSITAGAYDVYIRWPYDSGNASYVPVDVIDSHGSVRLHVNEKQAIGGDGWYYLGRYSYDPLFNFSVEIHTLGNDGLVIADAVKFHPVGAGSDVILDNTQTGTGGVNFSGGWLTASTLGTDKGRYGADYRYTDDDASGPSPAVAIAISDGALWHNLVQDGGWVFTQDGNAYAAIRQAGADPQYHYVSFPDDSDFVHVLRFDSEWAPVIIQMGVASDYASFDAFTTAVKAKYTQYDSTSYANGKLTYTSLGGTKFEYWTKDSATLPNPPQIPAINGVPLVLNPADTYQSPYIASPHGLDVTTVSYLGNTFAIDAGSEVRDDFSASIFCDNFNNGSMPGGWTGGTVGNQALQLSRTGTDVTATRTITPAQSGLVSVEWQITCHSGDQSKYDIKDSSGVTVFEMAVGADKMLKVNYDGTTSSASLALLAVGKAMKVKVVLDTTAHTAALYLNGSDTASDTHSFYSNGRSTDVAQVVFSVVNTDGMVRIDNLAVRNEIGTSVVNDNFNSGSMPSGWGSLVYATVTNQALKLSKPLNATTATAVRSFAQQSGIVTVEWEMTYNSGDMNRIRIEDNSGNILLSLHLRNNRILKLDTTSSVEFSLMTLTAGVPVRMKAILNTSTHKVTVYQNGSNVPAWSGNFYNNYTYSNVGKVDLSIIYSPAGDMVFDDLTVRTSSLPAGWTVTGILPDTLPGTAAEDDQGLRLSGASDITATKTLDVAQTGLVTVDWTMKYFSGAQEWFRIKDSSGNLALEMAIVDVNGTKKLQIHDVSTYYDFSTPITVDANDTFQVKATFNTNTKTMVISVVENGTVSHIYSGLFYGGASANATNIKSIDFQALNAGLGELWIDNFDVC